MAYIREFPNGDWTVLVEDDDRVGHAYLLHQGNIVSDVWLYNRGSAPEVAPWKSGAQMPFQNPAEYVTEESVVHELSPDSLSVSWSGGDESHPEAIVRIDNRPIAWLAPEAKPGWSALVKRNGPLARVRESGD